MAFKFFVFFFITHAAINEKNHFGTCTPPAKWIFENTYVPTHILYKMWIILHNWENDSGEKKERIEKSCF